MSWDTQEVEVEVLANISKLVEDALADLCEISGPCASEIENSVDNLRQAVNLMEEHF